MRPSVKRLSCNCCTLFVRDALTFTAMLFNHRNKTIVIVCCFLSSRTLCVSINAWIHEWMLWLIAHDNVWVWARAGSCNCSFESFFWCARNGGFDSARSYLAMMELFPVHVLFSFNDSSNLFKRSTESGKIAPDQWLKRFAISPSVPSS